MQIHCIQDITLQATRYVNCMKLSNVTVSGRHYVIRFFFAYVNTSRIISDKHYAKRYALYVPLALFFIFFVYGNNTVYTERYIHVGRVCT